MYLKIPHPEVTFESYHPFISDQLASELRSLANDLGHLRFVHINSTATGGGVAEILQSMVPLMNSLGIATERVVITPPPKFFRITKRIHNLLQGANGRLSTRDLETYFRCIQDVAEEINQHQLKADVWFLHDPQLLPLARLLPREIVQTWLWICHIDLSTPNQKVLGSLLPLTGDYDRLVVSLADYVPNGLGESPPVSVVPPAIDPLAPKNIPISEDETLKVVAAAGIDPSRPLISQVSRFDSWKDPCGVIDAFRLARQGVTGLQLALLGLSQATDDPEALDVLAGVKEHAHEDPDIHLYFDPTEISCSVDSFVNAFQTASQVVIQKSIREGFGLTVTEAMWKGKAVIGGNVGGIRIQIEDGVSGYLVNSPEECARRIVELMHDSGVRSRMGEAARERVRDRFLLPRMTLDYLQLVKSHLASSSASVNHDVVDTANTLPEFAPTAGKQKPVKVPVRAGKRSRV